MDVTGQDRIVVERDGEELYVTNHCSVVERHYVNSVNGYESFEPIISNGDSMAGEKPEYITATLAKTLYDEFGYEAEENGIEVIDFEEEEVRVL